MHLLHILNTFSSESSRADDLSLVVYSDSLQETFAFKNVGMSSYDEVVEFNKTAIPCNEFLIFKLSNGQD